MTTSEGGTVKTCRRHTPAVAGEYSDACMRHPDAVGHLTIRG